MRAGFLKEILMRKTIFVATALMLLSSVAMAEDVKATPGTGPAAQSDNMSKGGMSKTAMKKKTTKMKKSDTKM
jgi:hypothetical protein